MDNPNRARSWKRRIQPRVNLRIVEPVLYSTQLLVVNGQLLTFWSSSLMEFQDAIKSAC